MTRPGDEPWIPLTENFTYDAFGRRTSSRWFKPGDASAVEERSFYNHAGQLVYTAGRLDYETCGGVTGLNTFATKYIYLGRTLIATEDKGECSTRRTYQHVDHLGSVVARTDATGALVDRTSTNAYGLMDQPLTASRVGMGYATHQRDMSGLIYMQARYYDPVIGRFLSVDPVSPNNLGSNFNRYWYADNNPVSKIDPDGELSVFALFFIGSGLDILSQMASGEGSLRQRWNDVNVTNAIAAGIATAAIPGAYGAFTKANQAT